MDDELRIHHRAGPHGAFTVEQGSEQLGTLTYDHGDGKLVLVDTAVADDLRGQGAGAALIRAAVAYAREAHLEVEVTCPWATEYLAKHPELLEG